VTLVASRLGSNLRRIRLERRLSQEELMVRADVHRTQISKYERGEAEPQLETLARLAWALDVSADSLLAGINWQESPPRLSVESNEFDLQNGTSPWHLNAPAEADVASRADPLSRRPGLTEHFGNR
jgi:transcriptional regulator with XRE-family HTH domain